MSAYRYTLLDVFTDTPLAGNPLAVVHDADDLAEATMLSFARETRLSETTFVQAATALGADYRNRIWDPAKELPFAGHPSLGTAIAVARAADEAEVSYVQQTPAGLQPIDVRIDGARATASMLQEPAVFGEELDPAEVLAMVGLAPGDAAPDLPVQVVSTGVPQVIAPVAGEEVLRRCAPDYTRIEPFLDGHEAITLYVAAVDTANGDRARTRAFCHTAQMGEDPATGSAAGPLQAYLHRRAGWTALEITQGVEMGRPSLLRCEAGERVRVGGNAVAVVDGTVHL